MRLAGHGKKVLSLAIAAAMAVSVCTTGWAEVSTPETAESAQQETESVVETTQSAAAFLGTGDPETKGTGAVTNSGTGDSYDTVNAAIGAAQDGATIQLQQDVTEDVVIPEDKTLTLDLNGFTLKNAVDNTITNRGNLTVIGNGTVDSVANGKGALYNDIGAVATLKGGTFTRSKEAGTEAGANGNSWYTICNLGTMTIEKDVFVTAKGSFSSLVCNGRGSDQGGRANGTMIINGGTFQGGVNALINISGKVEINGGSLKEYAGGQDVIKNSSEATIIINGGEFTSQNRNAFYNFGIAEIHGGTFTGNANEPAVYNVAAYAADGIGIPDRNQYSTEGKLTITGGTFISKGQYSVYSTVETNGFFGYAGPEVEIDDGQFDEIVYCCNGTMTINGGLFTKSVEIDKFGFDNHNGFSGVQPVLTIHDGVFDEPVHITGSSVTLSIDGGKFSDAGTGSCIDVENASSTVNVSGGYYTAKVPKDYLAEGMACNLLDSLYEGTYAYQVGKSTAEKVEVTVEMAQPAVDLNATPETAGKVDSSDVKTAANNISVAPESEFDVLNAVKDEATLDGQPLDSEEVYNKAVAALAKDAGNQDDLEDITIVVEPYLNIKPVSADDREGSKAITFDIELQYRVKATADTADGAEVETTLVEGEKVQNPPRMDITLSDVSAIAIPAESDKFVYVKHNHEGQIFYYPGTVECFNGVVKSVTFTNLHGFSEFTVLTDTRYAQVKFPTTEQVAEYGPYSIGYTMPSPVMPGATFSGWQFEGIEGTYTVLTDELLTKLSDLYASAGKPIEGYAIFTQNSTGSDSTTTENTSSSTSSTSSSTTTTTQSGSNITYYTCPACGYHNWTAGTDGYKCDHCGYVESVKQLSGYGNVKGVYEPKTAAAAAAASGKAAATSAIPQTSDELPLVGLVVVAIAALLGLSVTVVMKKRSNR